MNFPHFQKPFDGPPQFDLDLHYEASIRARAFEKWLARGCPPHSELQDWLDAEQELIVEGVHIEDNPRLLQAIINNTTAVIYVKDRWGRYLFVNKWYESLFHISKEQVLGKTDSDLFPPEIARCLQANDQQVFQSNQPIEFVECVPQDDGLHTYLSLKFPLQDVRRWPFAVCGISTDISPRERLTQRLATEHAVAHVLAEAPGLAEAAPAILQVIGEKLGWSAGCLWCVEDTMSLLRCLEVWQAPGLVLPEFYLTSFQFLCERGVDLPGRAWCSQGAVWLEDLSQVPVADFPRLSKLRSESLRCALAVPVKVNEQVIGVLEFFDQRSHFPDENLLEMLEALGCQLGQFIVRKRSEKIVHERNMELHLAQRIQQRFFPESPEALPGLAIAAATQPAQETGGDYIDFIPLDEHTLVLALGDASGHGVGAALLMAITRAYLRAFIRTGCSFADVMPLLNRTLAEDMNSDNFVTLFAARLDRVSKRLEYCNAGQLPGIVIGRDGQVRHKLASTGFPLGLDADFDYPPGPTLTLQTGDLVLLLSDGITETSGPDGKQYGLVRAVDFVRARRDQEPLHILQQLFQDVRTYSNEFPQLDDRSALIVRLDS